MDPTFVINNAVSSLAVVLSIGIVAWSIVALVRARHSGKGTAQLPPASLQPLEERLDRMERATEAIALQVERVAEGQRFVTRLLAQDDKAQAVLPPAGNER